jgi:hypothetical protein
MAMGVSPQRVIGDVALLALINASISAFCFYARQNLSGKT